MGVQPSRFLFIMTFFCVNNSRADSRFAPSQWETVLLCNGLSHWLGAVLASAMNSVLVTCCDSHSGQLVRDHVGYGLSQWKTTLHYNVVYHCLKPCSEWSLVVYVIYNYVFCLVALLCEFNSLRLHLVTHICVGNLTIIGSDNGLSPDRRQAIIWINAGILLIWA